MSDLKPCPCGKTPTTIDLNGWYPMQKWTVAMPDCCNEWMFEFRSGYSKDQFEVEQWAKEAWNEMPRAGEQHE